MLTSFVSFISISKAESELMFNDFGQETLAEAQENSEFVNTPNTEELCLLGPEYQDIDKDGQSDACDGFIDEPPVDQPDDVGVVDSPDITNTTKDLPVSEVRPQWLLDLEAEIAKRNELLAQEQAANSVSQNTSQQNSATNNQPQSTAPESDTQDEATQNQPQASSATEVRGIEDTTPVASNQNYEKKNQINWLLSMPILVALLLSGYYLIKIAGKENNN